MPTASCHIHSAIYVNIDQAGSVGTTSRKLRKQLKSPSTTMLYRGLFDLILYCSHKSQKRMKMQVQIVVLPSENQIETMNKGALHEAYGLCQKSLDIEALKMQTLEAEIQKARVIDEERYEQIAENIELICSVQSMISDEIYYRRKYELYGYV